MLFNQNKPKIKISGLGQSDASSASPSPMGLGSLKSGIKIGGLGQASGQSNMAASVALPPAEPTDLTLIESETSLIGSRPGQLLRAKASIIYLPGFGCDFRNHENFKNLLTSYDYYAINFPAHGKSIWKDASQLTLTYFTNLVVDFIKERNLDKVIIIGHGSSAPVAANVSRILPDVVKGIVYISPIETSFQQDAGQVEDVMIPRLMENLEQLNRLKVFNYDLKANNSAAWKYENEAKLAYYNKNHDALSIILGYLLSDQLKGSIEQVYQTVSVPQLVVFGDSDGLIRIDEVMKKVPTLFKGADVSIIPIAGHEPAFDNPNNYFSNVITFIDKVIFEDENQGDVL